MDKGAFRGQSRPARRRLASVVLALALGGSLSACALVPQPIVTRLPGAAPAEGGRAPSTTPTLATPTADPDRSAAGDAESDDGQGETDCGGAAVVVTAGSPLVLRGDCPDVEVQGADLTVDVAGAVVGALRISGDRIGVVGDRVGSLELQGNDSSLRAAATQSVSMSGDRNLVEVTGEVESVRVSGNGNTVDAASVRAVVVQGSGNTVG